eukprot:9398281-Heterocapsa_arctica.AAC.1
MSFAVCKNCKGPGRAQYALPNRSLNASSAEAAGSPALGQMWPLRDAFLNPEKYGYTPANDMAEVFRTRFTFSFNTANPSDEIPDLFLR